MSASEQGALNAQWNAANEAQITEQARRAPHVLMRPRIFPDGNSWCALLGDDIQSGIVGFGSTPEAAAFDFDAAWRTAKAPPKPGEAVHVPPELAAQLRVERMEREQHCRQRFVGGTCGCPWAKCAVTNGVTGRGEGKANG